MVMAWYFDDERGETALSVLDWVREHGAVAPVLWPYEISNAFVMAERRKRTTERQTARDLERLSLLPIEIEDHRASPAILAGLARKHKLSSYDAAYLELALRRRLPLATGDDRLIVAARAAGIAVHKAH